MMRTSPVSAGTMPLTMVWNSLLGAPLHRLLGQAKPNIRLTHSRNVGHFRPKTLNDTDPGLPLSCSIRGISGGLGKCYGTSPNMLCRMDSPIPADTFTGLPSLYSHSPPPSSPILLLPFLTFRFLHRLRFFFQRYLPLPPLIIRLCMLELRRRPSTSRLLTVLDPFISLLPE